MPATPCPSCGKPSHAKVMCHRCRRNKRDARICARCGDPVKHGAIKFCSLDCFAKSDGERRRAMRPTVTAKSRRVDRSASAVGLGEKARLKLLHVWRKQGRTCTYCTGPADTVDHLIPLVRGGTNHEGNLTPACRSCNSRKQDRLVIEFRLGLRASQTYTPFRERPKAERSVKVKAEKPTATCYICASTYTVEHSARRTCGAQLCQAEHVRRLTREAYRERVGLPPTWERPSKPHKRPSLSVAI